MSAFAPLAGVKRTSAVEPAPRDLVHAFADGRRRIGAPPIGALTLCLRNILPLIVQAIPAPIPVFDIPPEPMSDTRRAVSKR